MKSPHVWTGFLLRSDAGVVVWKQCGDRGGIALRQDFRGGEKWMVSSEKYAKEAGILLQ